MDAFLDLFSLKRREGDRVLINWLVDIPVPGEEAYIGFFGRDISTGGIRLESSSLDRAGRVIGRKRQTEMKVRVPNEGVMLEVKAELQWGPLGDKAPMMGWRFINLGRDERRYIEQYVSTHKDDVVVPPQEGDKTA